VAGRPRKPTRLERRGRRGIFYILFHDGKRDRARSTFTSDRAIAERKKDDQELKRLGGEKQVARSADQYTVGEAIAFYLLDRWGVRLDKDPQGSQGGNPASDH
jgi:hypothetical protein